MKKAFRIVLLVLCILLLVGLIWESIVIARARRTVDFGGTVQEIIVDGDTVTFRVYQFSTYTVVADKWTKVSYCCETDGEITIGDIEVGDTLTGYYRWPKGNKIAQSIEVDYVPRQWPASD